MRSYNIYIYIHINIINIKNIYIYIYIWGSCSVSAHRRRKVNQKVYEYIWISNTRTCVDMSCVWWKSLSPHNSENIVTQPWVRLFSRKLSFHAPLRGTFARSPLRFGRTQYQGQKCNFRYIFRPKVNYSCQLGQTTFTTKRSTTSTGFVM